MKIKDLGSETHAFPVSTDEELPGHFFFFFALIENFTKSQREWVLDFWTSGFGEILIFMWFFYGYYWEQKYLWISV